MTSAFERLINLRQGSAEANVASLLREFLANYDSDIEWELETSVESGREDLSCTQLNVVIECKKTDTITQTVLVNAKEQLLRYVQDRHSHKDNLVWRGFITDGKLWWGFDYQPKAKRLKPIRAIVRYKMTEAEIFRDFCNTYIFSRYDPTRLRIPNIDDVNLLEKMFLPRFRELERVQAKVERNTSYKTKIKLWEMQLAGSGIIPSPDEPKSFADHFRRHSFIVTVARMLYAYLDTDEVSDDSLIEAASDGFQSWIFESEEGYETLVRLVQDLRQYSWRTTTKDVLKSLYHGLIPSDKRKEFGEYYTPDHLAVALVDELLDDAWCDEQIKRAWNIVRGEYDSRKGFGVLDPSCGSGTFLFHAARRLCDRIAIQHRPLKRHAAEIVSQLVFGIDVHPIAVEMSKATLMMALPASDTPIHVQVALGDAMQTEGEQSDLLVRDGLKVETPKGNAILISSAILSLPHCLSVIAWAVRQHEDDGGDGSDYRDDRNCVALAKSIGEVVSEEGNHVWNWHLANLYTLHRFVSGSVGRLIGNPPWLVQNEAPDGSRKKKIAELSKTEGTYIKVPGYLARGDLASVFTARVTRLYLDTAKGNNRYGWVLPGSALINQVWANWRDGALPELNLKHELAWSLDQIDPPIFSHAPNGTCVVIGSRQNRWTEPKMAIERWSGEFDTAEIVEDQSYPEFEPSSYSEFVTRGCFFGPFHYFIVDDVHSKNGRVWSIATQVGRKGQWSGKNFEGKVEKDALLPLVTSKELEPPFARSGNYLIAPLENETLMLPSSARARLYPKNRRILEALQ